MPSKLTKKHICTLVVTTLLVFAYIGKCIGQNTPNVCDYIVVGAGASGATIAGRLSELEDITVCLFEEGTNDVNIPLSPVIETPRVWKRLMYDPIVRRYATVPQNTLNGRVLSIGIGKVLGGSTSVNGMNYLRGVEADYDYWASQGATGWSYADVYPYFLKSENNSSPLLQNIGFHNIGGPLTISQDLQFIHTELYKVCTDSAKELGIPLVDCNQPSPIGLCQMQFNIKDGKRQSTSEVFLRPVLGRKNLFIITEALVEKILISHSTKRAYGIRFSQKGHMKFARARKEVIISAGAVDSPKLMQLSGVGPTSLLQKLKIKPYVDLPVGENYHDHYSFPASLFGNFPTASYEVLVDPEVLLEYVMNRTGVYAQNPTAFALFTDLKEQQPFNWPDVQTTIGDGFSNFIEKGIQESSNPNGTTFIFFLTHPKSRGTIQVKSRDPRDPPRIDPKCLQQDDDMGTLIAAVRAVRAFTRTAVMKNVNAEYVPGKGMPKECEKFVPDSNKQWECLIRRQLNLTWHPTGTCKMGDVNDRSTVVDPQLRVKGIKGLRVADASIMPEIVTTNTMGPCIMIGEKAADMIKQDYLKLL